MQGCMSSIQFARTEAVVGLVHEHAGTGLAAVAISSNSVETHPQDGPDRMVEDAKQFGDGPARLICSLIDEMLRTELHLRPFMRARHAA